MTEHAFVDKWLSFGAAVMDRGVSKSDLRVLWWIFNHANREHIAWPSTRGLARRAGINHRNIGRHLSRLVETGYVEIVRKGSQHGDANHYRLAFKGVEDMKNLRLRAPVAVTDTINVGANPVVHNDDTRGAIQADVTLSSALTRAAVIPEAKVSSALTTKPPTEPAHKAGEVVVGGQLRNGAQGAVLAAAPDVDLVLRQQHFDRFIEGYPLKSNVEAAEREFFTAIAQGVSVDLLVRQVAAYSERCERTKTPENLIQEPANWLRHKRWKDDFSAKPQHKKPTVVATATKKGSGGTINSVAEKPWLPTPEQYEAATRLARGNYDALKQLLDVVDPGIPLREKIMAVLELAHRTNEMECESNVGPLNSPELRDSLDDALERADRDEWSDAEGYDLDDNEIESAHWFGIGGLTAKFLMEYAAIYVSNRAAGVS